MELMKHEEGAGKVKVPIQFFLNIGRDLLLTTGEQSLKSRNSMDKTARGIFSKDLPGCLPICTVWRGGEVLLTDCTLSRTTDKRCPTRKAKKLCIRKPVIVDVHDRRRSTGAALQRGIRLLGRCVERSALAKFVENFAFVAKYYTFTVPLKNLYHRTSNSRSKWFLRLSRLETFPEATSGCCRKSRWLRAVEVLSLSVLQKLGSCNHKKYMVLRSLMKQKQNTYFG